MVKVSPGRTAASPVRVGVVLVVLMLSTVGAFGASRSSVTLRVVSGPDRPAAVFVTRVTMVQSALWAPLSCAVQLPPRTVASVQLAPPSNETCSTSLLPSGASMRPVTVRPAPPSAVMKSFGELPVSRVIRSMLACWPGTAGLPTVIVTFVVASSAPSLPRTSTSMLPSAPAGGVPVKVSVAGSKRSQDGSSAPPGRLAS